MPRPNDLCVYFIVPSTSQSYYSVGSTKGIYFYSDDIDKKDNKSYRQYMVNQSGECRILYKKITLRFKLSDLNLLNSNQRRRIKKVKRSLDEFLIKYSQLTCDGCKYKNEYLLTNKCHKTYEAITESFV